MRAFFSLLLLCGSGGCVMHTTIPEQPCEEAGVPLSDSSWPGPSEADVLAALESTLPNVVEWDEHTLGMDRSTVQMTPVRMESEAQVVTRSKQNNEVCRPGPELVLAMRFEVTVGDNEVVSLLTGTVAVGEEGTDPLYVVAEGPAVLSAEWEEAALAAVVDQRPESVAERGMVLFGVPWAESVLDVEASGEGNRTSLWRGRLAVE